MVSLEANQAQMIKNHQYLGHESSHDNRSVQDTFINDNNTNMNIVIKNQEAENVLSEPIMNE